MISRTLSLILVSRSSLRLTALCRDSLATRPLCLLVFLVLLSAILTMPSKDYWIQYRQMHRCRCSHECKSKENADGRLLSK